MKQSNKKTFFKLAKNALHNKKAFFVDTGVLILIAVVIGALTLGGLYVVTNDTIFPTVKSKIESMFDYSESVTPQKIKGDLNGDGIVDSADVSIMNKEVMVASGNYETADLDVNEDGVVDIKDLVRIKKLVAAETEGQ